MKRKIYDPWEILKLICPKGHASLISIIKDSDYRYTYCKQCGKAVYFKRKIKE